MKHQHKQSRSPRVAACFPHLSNFLVRLKVHTIKQEPASILCLRLDDTTLEAWKYVYKIHTLQPLARIPSSHSRQ
jgi:hypothetical protein